MAIRRLDFVGRTYNYIGWNEARPFFQSARVRQALTMAIDRKRIIAQTLNGLGIEIQGPFSPYSKAYDKSLVPWPYDPQVARSLLEKEGWYDRTGSGIISKQINGVDMPFRFTLIYYVKSPIGKSVVEYISGALKELGIDCVVNGVDIADLSSKFDDKDFDALFLGWAEGTPPEDPRQLWYSSGAKEKGSSNAIGFANPQIDRIIDQLQYEYNEDKRIELYHQFDRIIFEEAPYTFLYNPKSILVYRDYLQNVFVPANRQDLIPGADVPEPISSLFWIKEH
jgi:peptide/nickel transport system substrate-binding protein